jgi:hypothetical protein
MEIAIISPESVGVSQDTKVVLVSEILARVGNTREAHVLVTVTAPIYMT